MEVLFSCLNKYRCAFCNIYKRLNHKTQMRISPISWTIKLASLTTYVQWRSPLMCFVQPSLNLKIINHSTKSISVIW